MLQSVSKSSTVKERGIKIVHLKVRDLAEADLALCIYVMAENQFKTLKCG